MIVNGKFESEPPLIIFVELFGEFDLKDIIFSFEIDKSKYNLLLCRVFDRHKEHYTAIFRFNNSFYLVDVLSRSITKKSLET